MPGFGYGPFGRDPFGAWGWANQVLFQSAPAVYRQAQSVEGDYLQKFTAGQQPVFDTLRRAIAEYGSLRDPLTARTQTEGAVFLTLGRQIAPTAPAEQAGILGKVENIGIFKSEDRSAVFRRSDIGKQIFIRRSAVGTNNLQTFQIAGVVSEKEVLTSPAMYLDAGPMRWELRSPETMPENEIQVEVRSGDVRRIAPGWSLFDGKNSYEVVSRQMFYQPTTANQLLTERAASDGVISQILPGVSALSSATYPFKQTDVGKLIGITGATVPRNNGLWEIAAVIGNSAVFGVLIVPGENNDLAGKLLYGYTAATDRAISIEHLHDPLPSLPLEIRLNTENPELYAVQVRLSTDANGEISTLPSHIIAAVGADPVLSEILHVARPPDVPLAEAEVSEFSQTPVKPGFLPAETGLFWALRPYPRLVLRGSTPQGLMDWDGYDLYIGGAAETVGAYVQPAVGSTVVVNVAAGLDLRVNDNVEVANDGIVTGGSYVVTSIPSNFAVELYLVTPVTAPGGTIPSGAIIRTLYPTRVGSVSGPFLPGDVGKLLTIRGSELGGDGTYIIQSVYDPNRVEVNAIFQGFESGLYGARSTRPLFIPDPTRLNPQLGEVRAAPPPLLDLLAYDFGTAIDTQQTDLRQRSWVLHLPQVADLKGNLAAVEGVALLSGFRLALQELYAITPVPGMAPGYNLVFIGYPGRSYYANGLVVASPGVVRLITTTNTFLSSDLGKVVQVVATSPSNYGHYLIASVDSPTQVTLALPSVGGGLDPAVTPTVSEAGPLPITIGRVYTNAPSAFPSIDDINFDVVSDMYDLAGYTSDNRPGIDMPCAVQEIAVGTDPDGYGRATLDCAALTPAAGGYGGLLGAYTVGAGGNSLQYTIGYVVGGNFETRILGSSVVTTLPSVGPYPTPAELDAVFSGLTVADISVATPAVVTTSSPHGVSATGYTQVTLSDLSIPYGLNGDWYAQRVSDTQLALYTIATVPQPVENSQVYSPGGTLRNTLLYAKVRLLESSVSRGYTLPLSASAIPLTNFTGGAGNTPPKIVTLDPTPGTGGITITSVTSLGVQHTVTLEGEDMLAVASEKWKFKDLVTNNIYFLNFPPEQVAPLPPPAPQVAPWIFRVVVTANVPPTVGANVYFEYLCSAEPTCESCATNRVAVELLADSVLDEGATALESAFPRVIRKLAEALPANAVVSYRLSQYLRTPALYSATFPAPVWQGHSVATFRMVWTDYAKATYALTPPTPASFKVGLGGYTPEGDIRYPDAALTDLDIIVNPARYAADYPSPPYISRFYEKPLQPYNIEPVSALSGTMLRVTCKLEFPEYNSDGVGSPDIREIGIFDSSGGMVAYATLGGITKVESQTVTLLAELVL